MGRITVFSIDGCTHCRQLKAALAARNIPYSDINISHYPQKRSDMLALTDRHTVPQVFFNERYIGGADETIQLLHEWDEELKGGSVTARDRYVDTIESEPGPFDGKLSLPTGPPAIQYMNLTVNRPKEITEVNGKHFTTLQLTKELIKKMPRGDLSTFGTVYHNSFKGSEAVTALMKAFDLKSKDEAVQLGMKLQRKHFIEHASKGDHSFGDNKFYFRLYPFHTPHVLNSLRAWNHPSNDEPINVIILLSKLWDNLESRHFTPEGLVNHATLRHDDFYWKFEDDSCELQTISLKDMDDNTKTAFVINLYNLMIKYAFVKMGVPTSDTSRHYFYDNVCVNLGGAVFSLNDLEHGILRANAKAPYRLTKQFTIIDSRKNLALNKMDSRIHFALNCGAKSCPSVKRYTVEALDEELRLAAMAFCEQDDNVSVDDANSMLGLSKIFYWYMSDFG
ncbi:hypothetical protein HJC23_010095 [Cyclotella cryptica]|uniref:DEP domain-containing protein n=1 Tax=Cyclotella cryptica TaxID=29204 RepID=A0ABD3Q2Y1_9STRA